MDSDLEKFTKCDIFTPDNISLIMSSKLKKNGNLLEPAVGDGNLLKHLNIDNYENIDVYELKKIYLEKIQNNTKIKKFNLDFLKTKISKKYDNIILNPPYIKMQDLSEEYRAHIKNTFDTLRDGIVDIYYAFIIKCINLLKNDGIMVSITPNSYLYNKSSFKLRKYLFDNKLIKEIIDYNDKKVFKGVSVYCCITIFTKCDKTNLIYNDKEIKYDDITKNYSLFNFNNNTSNTLSQICKIKNGIATLRDKIYIHNNKLFDEPCWEKITNGPNDKYIIYPYNNGKIIDENEFKKTNPKTYNYLSENKDELLKRDKGKKTYASWYAYGRTQSIKYSNKLCLYIPCFLDPLNIDKNIFTKSSILHQSCLCIEPNDEKDLEYIKMSIIKNKKFIEENSSKRSGGWVSLSSRILNQIELD